MSAHENGGPAFPEQGSRGKAASGEGMSLRDYFAAKAMQGMYASDTPEWFLPDGQEYRRAEAAYRLADAMLKERAK